MKRWLVTGIVFICILLFCSKEVLAAKDKNEKSSEYRDRKDRYSLVLPGKWIAFEQEEDVYFEYDSKEFYASFYITRLSVTKEETLKEFVSNVQPYSYKGEGLDVQSTIIDKTEAKVDGVQAIHLRQKSEAKEKYNGQSYSEITFIDEFYFIKNNQIYIITLNVTENGYEKVRSDFEAIVKSFKAGIKPFEEMKKEE